jgi:hypothetical protein
LPLFFTALFGLAISWPTDCRATLAIGLLISSVGYTLLSRFLPSAVRSRKRLE